jgi:O-antigen ligase
MLIWCLALAYCCVNGALRGAAPDLIVYQSRPIVVYALMLAAYQASYRGPRDHALLGGVVLTASLFKACLGSYFHFFVYDGIGRYFRPLEYATNHWDSILFVLGCAMLLANLAERTDRRRAVACLLGLPILLLGMIVNQRRIAWVELAAVCMMIYFLSPWRAWKRALTRTVVVLIPIALAYLGAGWNSSMRIFAPVAFVRSLTDAKVDRSTLDRDVENWNLVLSVIERPVLGRGFGFGYTEYIKGDDISIAFPQYRAGPHNSILGWVLFGGLIGFAGFFSLYAVGLFLGARAYRFARDPADRAAALTCIALIVAVLVQGYGDLGLGCLQACVLAPLALTLAGKLAVATGAWPERRREALPAELG